MAAVSTWSQDVARGLGHPVSVQARVQRIALARQAQQTRTQELNLALGLIRRSARTEQDLIQVLHTLSNALQSTKPVMDSDMEENIQLLDMLADQIEFRHEAQA